MAYIGTNAPTGFSTSAKDTFSGDNSTTAFTMSRGQSTANDVQVFVDNVRQEPVIAYNVSGATLTFTEAPPTGTNNIYCVHNSNQAVSVLPPADLGSRDYVFGDDVSLKSDSAVLNFGLDSEIKLAHVHNTGLSLQSDSSQLLFGADNDINLTHVHNTGLTTNGNFSLKSDSSVLKFGADEEVTLTHNHNAGLTLGGTTPTLTIGDAGAEDTKIVFDGNAQDFHIGLDDSTDDLVIGLGSTLGTTSHMVFDENGIITKPLQPAFLAVPASAQNNIATGNVTTTLVFGTEVYDQNGDYASNTFTAPVTGRYYLNVQLRIDDLDIDVDFYELQIVTSNRTYIAIIDPDLADQNMGYYSLAISVVADMDAADTAIPKIRINGGETTMGMQTASHFSGCLLA